MFKDFYKKHNSISKVSHGFLNKNNIYPYDYKPQLSPQKFYDSKKKDFEFEKINFSTPQKPLGKVFNKNDVSRNLKLKFDKIKKWRDFEELFYFKIYFHLNCYCFVNFDCNCSISYADFIPTSEEFPDISSKSEIISCLSGYVVVNRMLFSAASCRKLIYMFSKYFDLRIKVSLLITFTAVSRVNWSMQGPVLAINLKR